MKKNIILRVGIAAVALMMAGSTVAQDTIPVKTLPPVTITPTSSRVPDRVWKNFDTYFANAQDPKWYMLNKQYLVKFMTDENENKALFSKRGALVYHISYGYERSLAQDMKDRIHSVYGDYDITRAIKVSESNRVIWVINLESAKNYVLVRFEGNEMEEVEKLDKS